jgi:hypothetical protein
MGTDEGRTIALSSQLRCGGLVGALLAALASTGCIPLAGVAVGTVVGSGVRSEQTRPKAETEENCKSWECWDGYACGPCPGTELPEDE